MRGRRTASGFTLVELLLALFVMALLAVLSWRGLDGMVRAQETTRTRADEVQALQVGLSQWTADLDALVQLPQITALDWNGRVVRMTRHSPVSQQDGVVVVAWSRRAAAEGPRWMRWQSPPLTSRGQVEEAWARADAWAQGQAGVQADGSTAVAALLDWQVFFYRADAWTNPLSSDATAAATPQPPASAPATPPGQSPSGARTAQLPDGVRIVLALAPGQAITGDLTRDWVRPTVGGSRP